jgi:hypothetical protein
MKLVLRANATSLAVGAAAMSMVLAPGAPAPGGGARDLAFVQSSGTTGNLEAISCPSTADCVAVGGGIVATTDGGGKWASEKVPAIMLEGSTARDLTGVSCPSAKRCTAVGFAGTVIATANGLKALGCATKVGRAGPGYRAVGR